MDLLKRRIIEDGTELGTEVVKVDSFLNHQLDIGLFMAIGKEISRRFGHLGINKILTIESSGIGIAAITALYFDLVPVVFAKKTQPNTMTEDLRRRGKILHKGYGFCCTRIQAVPQS